MMWCDVMGWDGMWCDVMWCDVMWCDVMWVWLQCVVNMLRLVFWFYHWSQSDWNLHTSLSLSLCLSGYILSVICLFFDSVLEYRLNMCEYESMCVNMYQYVKMCQHLSIRVKTYHNVSRCFEYVKKRVHMCQDGSKCVKVYRHVSTCTTIHQRAWKPATVWQFVNLLLYMWLFTKRDLTVLSEFDRFVIIHETRKIQK